MIQKQEISKFSEKILRKPWLLTFIGVLAIGHIGIMAFKNNILAICVFFAISFILSFFTDFWVVILCVSMVISGCFHYKVEEGFSKEQFTVAVADEEKWLAEKVKLLNEIYNLKNSIDIMKDEHSNEIDLKNSTIKVKESLIKSNKDKLIASNEKFGEIKTMTNT